MSGRIFRATSDYTLTIWDKLNLYVEHGCLEIANNWIENGIRPTAIGTKNWLFIGGETTGQRSAIIYTLVECARRHGHDPEAYLSDILERLPAMTNQDDLSILLPSNWQPTVSAPAIEVAATIMPRAKLKHRKHTHLCMVTMLRRPVAPDALP